MRKKQAVDHTNKKPRPAYVRWVDASATEEWEDVTSASSLVLGTPETLGWIISEDGDAIRICATCDFQDLTVGSAWAIPKANVVEIVYLDAILEKTRKRKK